MIKMQIPKLTYEYYFAEYCGGSGAVIPEDSFDFAARRAAEALGAVIGCGAGDCTADEGAALDTAVCGTLCRMAEEIYRTDSRGGIKSENTDGYTVTYADGNENAQSARLLRIAAEGLAAYGIMYSGVE